MANSIILSGCIHGEWINGSSSVAGLHGMVCCANPTGPGTAPTENKVVPNKRNKIMDDKHWINSDKHL